jgi:hypothetical protein
MALDAELDGKGGAVSGTAMAAEATKTSASSSTGISDMVEPR